MATDETGQAALRALLRELARPEWSVVLRGVAHSEKWLVDAGPGAPGTDELVEMLVDLSRHSKWEVRRAIAQAAGQSQHTAFEAAIARLATDDNSRVRQAAEQASTRRRDWRNASLLGKQHEDRINSSLDDIEARFGQRGREAVRRASEEIANTYSRELYHEVVKLLTPLAISAERLAQRLADEATPRDELRHDATKIQERVARLRTILDAMRAFTAMPRMHFADVPLREIVEEAASLVGDTNRRRGVHVAIDVRVPPSLTGEVDRGRLVQAFTNLLHNATEAYDGLEGRDPVLIEGIDEGTRAILSFRDSGCGMSQEALNDAPVLFSTSKRYGTGFGLPLAIKIVESEHTGQLKLTSERGVGTRVEVRLPRHRG
ncbi:MAG: HEAT repeat domain-containing protein [Deltaproteobacteria bacterium]|nr:HEAT repeat domain-containing protein [Deltaproteobacteria bacterium]